MRAFSLLKLLLLLSFFFDLSSLRTADVFPVVASLPSKNNACEPDRQIDFRERYFSEGEKRRPEIRVCGSQAMTFFPSGKSMQTNKQTNKNNKQNKTFVLKLSRAYSDRKNHERNSVFCQIVDILR